MKKAPFKMKGPGKKMPKLGLKKLPKKASFHGQTGPSKPDEKMNRRYS
mgnify:CR=1 FL=1|jgi:hypothetical protein